MNYRFKNRYLLQLALTHPSYRENYGTNPDHSRNTQTNCGIRQAEYGDRDQYFQAIRKRGTVNSVNYFLSEVYENIGRLTSTTTSLLLYWFMEEPFACAFRHVRR